MEKYNISKSYFIFSIIDKGILQASTMMIDSDLTKIIEHAEQTIESYLELYGFEGTTEDGYCKVICLSPGVAAENAYDDWGASFDEDFNIAKAIKSLKEREWNLTSL